MEFKKGERAIFSFDDFVGMSDTLTVDRIVSLSISTMIFGRIIFHATEGPGVLLVTTKAAAPISSTDEADAATQATKLVSGMWYKI